MTPPLNVPYIKSRRVFELILIIKSSATHLFSISIILLKISSSGLDILKGCGPYSNAELDSMVNDNDQWGDLPTPIVSI